MEMEKKKRKKKNLENADINFHFYTVSLEHKKPNIVQMLNMSFTDFLKIRVCGICE